MHDSAPYFGACLPEIWGQDREKAALRYSYKNRALGTLVYLYSL